MPNKLKKLHDLENAIADVHSAHLCGEEYHPGYKKHPKIFNMLTRSDMATERGMRKYFKDQAKRSSKFIDWKYYKKRVKKVHQASLEDYFVVDWKKETLNMRILLTQTLVDAIVAGGMMTELDTKIDIGWGKGEPPAQEFLRKHSLKLAGQITDSTKKRILKSLELSIDLGEDRAGASGRIADILDDKRRAAVIAHTESVRAFSEGRLEVAKRVGADRKQWDATIGACPICQDLDGQVVKREALFPGGFSAPPAHPNCRCLIKILMPGEKK